MFNDDVAAGSAEQPVEIHLATTIEQAGDVSNYNFDVDGKLFQIGDTIYLRFMEDDNHDGHGVPVTIRINANGHVKLTRAGENKLQLDFIQGKRVEARYQTPYGLLPIETVTPNLDIQYQNQPLSGNVMVDYNLYAQEQLLGRYQLRLQFTV
ncbi:DUF1934 domain-containing protein [Acetilactobacillus jinshanensis]|uniref:DUF1934 domain-containing protein n=1 Tax=Acetilactobacillus jinshanensis TaxID=1720083 RepID=UPI001F267908|nr:DUF1934 domain-containing protein [Acetilactobacillus jinshanensis]